MTPFEQAQQDVKDGKQKTPVVSQGGKNMDYFGWQLSVHHYNLKIMKIGMKVNGITFTQIKKYYGLKGRSVKDVMTQFVEIKDNYFTKFE